MRARCAVRTLRVRALVARKQITQAHHRAGRTPLITRVTSERTRARSAGAHLNADRVHRLVRVARCILVFVSGQDLYLICLWLILYGHFGAPFSAATRG